MSAPELPRGREQEQAPWVGDGEDGPSRVSTLWMCLAEGAAAWPLPGVTRTNCFQLQRGGGSWGALAFRSLELAGQQVAPQLQCRQA